MGMNPGGLDEVKHPCYFAPSGRELSACWRIGSCPFVDVSAWGFHPK